VHQLNRYFHKINDYYDQSLEDYRLIWNSGKNYALHAGYYDTDHKRHDEALLNMNRFVSATAKIKRASKVLDAGCGIGGTSIWIAKVIGARVTGININENQIKIATDNAKKEGVEAFTDFKALDYHNTRLKAGSYDSVIAIESICHSDDKLKFLKEANRILKKNGTIAIADGFRSRRNNSESDEAALHHWLDGWAVHDLATIQEFKDHLKKAGFKNIVFKDITRNVMKSSFRLYVASIVNYPIAKLLELLKIRTKVQTGNLLGAYYQYGILKRRIWRYCVFYAEK
jgi:tocopherol O-methyltransferase